MHSNHCDVCAQIYVDEEVPRKGLHPGFENVARSAKQGCAFCSLVIQAIRLFLPPLPDSFNGFPEDAKLIIYQSTVNGKGLILWVHWTNLKDHVNIDDFVVSGRRIELFTLISKSIHISRSRLGP